jgi:hypothetical protein
VLVDNKLSNLLRKPLGDGGELLPGYFDYCKHWLRRYSRDSNVDRHELQINARLALLLPIAMLAPTAIVVLVQLEEISAWSGSGLLLTSIVAAASMYMAWFLLYRALERQGDERCDSLNYYVAGWLTFENAPKGAGNTGPQSASEW